MSNLFIMYIIVLNILMYYLCNLLVSRVYIILLYIIYIYKNIHISCFFYKMCSGCADVQWLCGVFTFQSTVLNSSLSEESTLISLEKIQFALYSS